MELQLKNSDGYLSYRMDNKVLKDEVVSMADLFLKILKDWLGH